MVTTKCKKTWGKQGKYPPPRSKNHPNYPRKNHLEDAVHTQICNKEGDSCYEQAYLNYTVPQRNAKYTPDFILPNGIIIEVKGLLEVEDRQKHILIKEQYPELDIRFVFGNANTPIRSGSKTTYADWCDTHGFLYANKTIPKAWLLEPFSQAKEKEINRIMVWKAEDK